MLRQAQARGKETGPQRCPQEQRRYREERQKKDERGKHHAVRTHNYGQPGLEPGHSDNSCLFHRSLGYNLLSALSEGIFSGLEKLEIL